MKTAFASIALAALFAVTGCAVTDTSEDVNEDNGGQAISGSSAMAYVRQVRSAYENANDDDLAVSSLDEAPARARHWVERELATWSFKSLARVATLPTGKVGTLHVVELDQNEAGTKDREPVHELYFFDAQGQLRASAADYTGSMIWYLPVLSADGSIKRVEAVE